MARVLVIDDDEIMLTALADVLEQGGFEVETLGTPIGATKLIARGDVAAIVVDLNMPSMRGDRFVAMLLGWRPGRRLPVVLISGAETHTFAHLVANMPDVTVLSKTDMRRHLVPTLRRALGER